MLLRQNSVNWKDRWTQNDKITKNEVQTRTITVQEKTCMLSCSFLKSILNNYESCWQKTRGLLKTLPSPREDNLIACRKSQRSLPNDHSFPMHIQPLTYFSFSSIMNLKIFTVRHRQWSKPFSNKVRYFWRPMICVVVFNYSNVPKPVCLSPLQLSQCSTFLPHELLIFKLNYGAYWSFIGKIR